MPELSDEGWERDDSVRRTIVLPSDLAERLAAEAERRGVSLSALLAEYAELVARGYGLVDSPTVEIDRGRQVNLSAGAAPNDAAAAQYHPAIYWYSMLKITSLYQFGGRGIAS